MAASPGLLNGKTPSPTGGVLSCPATPARTAHPRATCGWAGMRLGRRFFKQMETLAGWNGPAHPHPRRAHRDRSLVERNLRPGPLSDQIEEHWKWTGTHQRAQFAERPKGRPLIPKIVMAHKQPIQRTYVSWGKPKVAADANCLTIPTEVSDMRHRKRSRRVLRSEKIRAA